MPAAVSTTTWRGGCSNGSCRGLRCRQPSPRNGDDVAAATRVGSTSTPVRGHALGDRTARRDDSAVLAFRDQVQGLAPIEIRVRTAEPQTSRLVAENGAKQVDDGLQLEQPILGLSSGNGLRGGPAADTPRRGASDLGDVAGIDDVRVDQLVDNSAHRCHGGVPLLTVVCFDGSSSGSMSQNRPCYDTGAGMDLGPGRSAHRQGELARRRHGKNMVAPRRWLGLSVIGATCSKRKGSCRPMGTASTRGLLRGGLPSDLLDTVSRRPLHDSCGQGMVNNRPVSPPVQEIPWSWRTTGSSLVSTADLGSPGS